VSVHLRPANTAPTAPIGRSTCLRGWSFHVAPNAIRRLIGEGWLRPLAAGKRRCLKDGQAGPDIPSMTTGSSTGTLLVVFDGGPADAHEHVTGVETEKVIVALPDASWHLYEREPAERMLPDGRRAVVFGWRGRR
jgi:hypothetical protein